MTTDIDTRQLSLTRLVTQLTSEHDPLERLALLRQLKAHLADEEKAAVEHARTQQASWEAIGAQLGVSKQAASRRFRPPNEARADTPADPAGAAGSTSANEKPRSATKARGWCITTPGGRTLLQVQPSNPSPQSTERPPARRRILTRRRKGNG